MKVKDNCMVLHKDKYGNTMPCPGHEWTSDRSKPPYPCSDCKKWHYPGECVISPVPDKELWGDTVKQPTISDLTLRIDRLEHGLRNEISRVVLMMELVASLLTARKENREGASGADGTDKG